MIPLFESTKANKMSGVIAGLVVDTKLIGNATDVHSVDTHVSGCELGAGAI